MAKTKRERLIAEIQVRKALAQRQGELHANYKPYPKQREFHRVGVDYSERNLMAGNQLGKTYSGAMEAFFHLSGLYPVWWEGIRFDQPTTGWVGGETGESIRDTTQRLLLDRPGKLAGSAAEYKGIVPQRLVVDEPKSALGTANLFDYFKVRHVSGGVSYCYFKAYAKGRAKWQGETIDWIWFDEEPPEEIYAEGLTRTNRGQRGQCGYMTFTPLKGMSNVVHKFLMNPSLNQIVVNMTIDDVNHYSDAEKAKIVASYPVHEREARAKGIPVMGSGRIFPVPEEDILEEPLNLATVPDWWLQIAGMDFGWDHPAAAVRLLYDPENDVVHLHAEYRERQQTALMFAAGVKAWGDVPFAWPHDGLQHEKGSGEQLANQYRNAGMNMLDDRATFEDGGSWVEPGIEEMLDRMLTGRFKVSRTMTKWLEEFRLYHRKDGKIVKERDDLISASRYALMMLRFAVKVKVRVSSRTGRGGSWRAV